jgi:hypothetical protein
MPGAIPESNIVRAWQQGLTGRQDLLTEDGGPLRIIYPGRLNDDRGADLKDAVVMTRQGTVRGDVEVHVKSSSWWGHGHHLDPAYNRVVLHVVYRHDTVFPARLQNGTLVPTLALQRFLPPSGLRRSTSRPRARLPCTGRKRPQVIGMILDCAGDERFREKTANFLDVISREGDGQALYSAIMAALGYAHNKEPMLELARQIPLGRLEALFTGNLSQDDCLSLSQAYLLGAAGLLPSQRRRKSSPENIVLSCKDRLEDIWHKSGQQSCMTEDDWHFFKVRPGNHPDRRIAAMTCLLARYREKGLLETFCNIFEATAEDNLRSLASALYIDNDTGYAETGSGTALLGKERAAEIVVNVFLPFMNALGETMSRPETEEKARRFYRRYPATAGNTIERHMRRQLGLEPGVVDTAQRQQGLLHIFKKHCSQGRCVECPLGVKAKAE